MVPHDIDILKNPIRILSIAFSFKFGNDMDD